MIKRIIANIKNNKQNIIDLKNNKNLESVLNISISLITYTSIINFIYVLVMFIIKHGFKNEFNLFTWSYYFNIAYLIISLLLVIVSLIMIYVNYYKNERKKTPSILLVISLVFAGIIFIYFLASYSCKKMTKDCKLLEKLLTINGLVVGNNVVLLLLGFIIISLILFITSLVIMGRKAGYDDNIYDLISISLFSLLIIPLILLFISNIVPLAVWLLIIVGIYIGYMIFFFIMSESIGGGIGYVPSIKTKSEKDSKPNKTDNNIKKFNGNVEFVREYSYNSSAELIYSKRWNGKNVVCSSKDFDSGKVVIEKNGKRVTYISKEKK